MIPNSTSNKGYVCIDMQCSSTSEPTASTSSNRSIKLAASTNVYPITRNDSELTLNDFLDNSSSTSSLDYINELGSQLTLNDFLDNIKTNEVDRTCTDVVINIPQEIQTNTQENDLLLSDKNNSICIEIDERITKILTCKQKYQLDSIIHEIIPKENESAETVLHLMRVLNDQYHQVYNQSGCFYKAYMAIHNKIEQILPYAFRAGGGISIHLLIQALFFNGDYNKSPSQSQQPSLYTSPSPTINTEAFLSNVLSLDITQVRILGDLLSATLFHAPTIFYQYPKLIDEVKYCISNKKITGSVIARFTLCLTSTLLTMSPLLMLNGAVKTGSIVRTIGRGVSYVDIPLALAILGDSWYKAYKHGSSDNPNSAQRFISQEAAFKTTQRVLTQGLSLMSSLSGAIMRSLEKGTPPQMMSLFIVNILNTQAIALCVDLQHTKNITMPLFKTKDRISYAFNGQRTSPEDQKQILKEVINSCTQGERAILNTSQSETCKHKIDEIYEKRFSETELNTLPNEMKNFLIFLNKTHEKDISRLSMGNEVNEKIIAVIVKTLAYRESMLC
ncbi:hypothetical protein D4089_005164 [Escherichia coli]|nr:hypothetical protein [Escherichia coli]